MIATLRPAFERGVKLRAQADGGAMLLVPEGALQLNPSAAATLALVDGARTVDDIVAAVCAQFAVDRERARADVVALLERLAERRMVILA